MKWIDLKDKIPKTNEFGDSDRVLTCFSHEQGKLVIESKLFENKWMHNGKIMNTDFTATHWMQLPEPPK